MDDKIPGLHSDSDILGGTPVFVGTRVPVRALLDYLEHGIEHQHNFSGLKIGIVVMLAASNDVDDLRPIVRRFTIAIGRCRQCARRVQGRHPLQTTDALGAAAVHVGPQAVALMSVLKKYLGLSHAKVATLLRERFGLTVTPSAVTQALHRAARQAQPTYAALRTVIRGSPVVAHHTCLAHLLRRCRELREASPRAVFPRRIQTLLRQASRVRDRRAAGTISSHGAAVARGARADTAARRARPPRAGAGDAPPRGPSAPPGARTRNRCSPV